jgi:hypothetical protein
VTERSTVDRELDLLLRGARVVFVFFVALVVLAIGLWIRGPRGPHPYGDGQCFVVGAVGQCIMP